MSVPTGTKDIALVFHAKIDGIPKPTAAGLMPTRLFAPTDDTIFLASGANLSLLTPSFPSAAATSANLLEQQRRADANAASSGSGSLVTGKHVQQRTVSAPIPMDGVRVHPLLSLAKTTNTATAATAATASATTNDGLPAHRFELQSIDVLRSSVAGSYRIAAVDALGHVSVSSVTVGPPTASDSKTQRSVSLSGTAIASPAKAHESGWCGVALHPTNPQQVATASHFGQTIAVYDVNRMSSVGGSGSGAAASAGAAVVSVYNTPLMPTQIKFWAPPAAAAVAGSTTGSISFKTAPKPATATTTATPAPATGSGNGNGNGTANGTYPVLLATEGNCVSVWDVRTNKGSVARMRPSEEVLYSLAIEPVVSGSGSFSGSGHLFAVSGAADIVYVYDVRTMRVVRQWAKLLKYECVSLAFSGVAPGVAYVTGLDHEIFCGTWDGSSTGGGGGGGGDEYYDEEEEGEGGDVEMKTDTTKSSGGGGSSMMEDVSGGGGGDDDAAAGGLAASSKLRRHGFRGDSRWIGLDRVTTNDAIVGITETANLYVVRRPYLMNPAIRVPK